MTCRMKDKSITVIGTGALGIVLTRVLHANRFEIKSLFNRTPVKTASISNDLKNIISGTFPESKADLGDLVFLTVPDREIKLVTDKLAELGNDFSDRMIIHCSGNHTSDVLQSVKQKGAAVGSFHPLQTFTAATDLSAFNDIYIDIEGDRDAVSLLKELAFRLGSQPIVISKQAKPYLHAAAVMASNYVAALVESAGQIAELGGIDKKEAQRALIPLLLQSAENITESDNLTNALSGPILRGDAETVEHHLQLLEQNSRLLKLYKHLGKKLIESMNSDQKTITDKHEDIRKLLAD